MAIAAPAQLYVYYRIGADAAAARRAVAGLLADVTKATGVAGRLVARCDDATTWMEIYEPVDDPEDFARRLAALVATHGAGAFAIDGTRHVECFRALPEPDAAAPPRPAAAAS